MVLITIGNIVTYINQKSVDTGKKSWTLAYLVILRYHIINYSIKNCYLSCSLFFRVEEG